MRSPEAWTPLPDPDAVFVGGSGREISRLVERAYQRLKPGGRMYVMVSSDSDLELFSRLIDHAGFQARQVHEHSFYIESMIIYELTVP